MGKSQYQIRGNVVRLFYNPDKYKGAFVNFYDLMFREGSAVSRSSRGIRTNIHQVPDVYYWNGAVLTHGENKQGYSIEMQKCAKQHVVDILISQLESKMKVKFRKRTISKL